MAGSGRRVFVPGEVLTASNVMDYLQDQVVQNYAGTAARGSAIGTAVSEGMVSYLNDLNQIQVYTGSAWQQVYPAKPLTGNVVQVVSTPKLDTFTSTSTTYVDVTGLSVTITPQSDTNKILILCSFMVGMNNRNGAHFQLAGGNAGTYIGNAAGSRVRSATSHGFVLDDGYHRTSQNIIYLDSPATTSATTYKLQGRVGTTGTLTINRTGDDIDDANRYRGASSITAIEIVA